MMPDIYEVDGQLTLLDPDDCGEVTAGKKPRRGPPPKDLMELIAVPIQVLDLTPGHGDLMGDAQWEIRSPFLEDGTTLNTGVAPREPIYSSLSSILEPYPDLKHYLSKTACRGILRRADERGKELPEQLHSALLAQAGLAPITATPIDCLEFAANQRDEVSDLHDVAGALASQTGMKQQAFIAAGFCAGAGPSAGGIGYMEEISPTLKAAESGTNMVPSVLCLNDQGGGIMDLSEDMSGTIRAQNHGHQPVVFENHGIAARYRGPLPVAPTLSTLAGTGGNNLPIALQHQETICISGNAIDRQPQNGGNGLGCQENIAYTLTATDHHAVYSRQRVDVFRDDNIASTESARQHKDATDLVCQPMYQTTVGALTSSDHKGPNNQYVGQDKLVVDGPLLIRRLSPLECERLQGFDDDWTNLPGASDSARYRALGNSVAIPCVEYITHRIVMAAAETVISALKNIIF